MKNYVREKLSKFLLNLSIIWQSKIQFLLTEQIYNNIKQIVLVKIFFPFLQIDRQLFQICYGFYFDFFWIVQSRLFNKDTHLLNQFIHPPIHPPNPAVCVINLLLKTWGPFHKTEIPFLQFKCRFLCLKSYFLAFKMPILAV